MPGIAFPKRTAARRGAAGGDRLGNAAQARGPLGQGQGAGNLLAAERVGQPAGPVLGRRRILFGAPYRQAVGIGKGWALAPQSQLEIAGVAQVLAPARAAVTQRMFQQRHQPLGAQLLGEQLRDMAQKPARRRKLQRLPGAVIRHKAPSVQCRSHPPRQHPVRRDQRRGLPVLGRLAQPQRDRQRLFPRARRLDQRQVARGLGDTGQVRPFLQPGIGKRCRAQRKRNQPIARGRGGRGPGPGADIAGRKVQRLHDPRKPELRMIFRHQRIAHILPDAVGLVEIETGQHNRPLRQPRHRLKQHQRGPARTGGAGHDHRMFRRIGFPARDQRLDNRALPRLHIALGLIAAQIVIDDADKILRPRPVTGHVRHVQIANGLGADTFGLHLVHQGGKAVGQAIGAGPCGQIRLRLQQAGDQLRQFQAAAQRRHRRRDCRGLPVVDRVGHQRNPRQQPRRPGVEDIADAPRHAPRVHHQMGPRQRLGRLPVQPRGQPGNQLSREIHPRRQRENARRVRRVKPAARTTGLRPA